MRLALLTRKVALMGLVVCWVTPSILAQENPVTVEGLRCEYLVNPLGIDVARPRLSWLLRDARRGAKQTAYHVLVASSPEKLAADQGDLWDSGKVLSDQSIHVEYAGQPLESRRRCYWKVRLWDKDDQPSPWSAPASWTMGLLKKADWEAHWITLSGATYPAPALMLRKEFSIPAPIERATVWVTGLGTYELRINGRQVDERILAPEWTRYEKRIQYQTYDITDLLREGKNALGAQLGEGWWAGPLMEKPPIEKPRFCLLLRLEVELIGGQVLSVVTDASWRATVDGPIRRAGIYYGESYDARKEMPAWDQPDFDDAGWRPVEVLSHPDGAAEAKLVAQPNQPIRVTEELQPIKILEPKPGVYIFDLGQNIAGWCRLKIDVPTGEKIVLRHGEMLNDDGTLYTANLRNATQIVEYISRGGPAVWEPHFTYFGFRYVALTGLPYRPNRNTLLARVLHSDAPKTGYFSCSNLLINRIMDCIDWTQRANMFSVPTDCPQRDEREGWLGDIQTFSQTAIFNRDLAAFFTKWVSDIRDSQADDGRYPNVAPTVRDPHEPTASGAPAWADAGLIIPWRMYVNYADRRMLQQHFDSARRWVDFIHSKNPDLLWRNKRGGDWGDWLNGETLVGLDYPRGVSAVPKEVLATAFFAHSAETLGKIAAVLDRQEDARTYAKLFQDIKTAFNKAYVAVDGKITGDTQAGYALALHFNLLDEPLRTKAVEHLLEAIRKFKGHPSTGIQTTHRMLLELSRSGHHDEACRLLNLRTVPSWGYMVEQGATTIWERWDGYVTGRGFQAATMNSFNHWAFGSVGEWLWRELAGIHPDEAQPGYKHFFIRPRPCAGLDWVRAQYESICGTIISEWKIADGRFHLHLVVPANTTAAVFLPVNDSALVTESGQPAANSRGVVFLRLENDWARFSVEAGSYDFVIPWNDNHGREANKS